MPTSPPGRKGEIGFPNPRLLHIEAAQTPYISQDQGLDRVRFPYISCSRPQRLRPQYQGQLLLWAVNPEPCCVLPKRLEVSTHVPGISSLQDSNSYHTASFPQSLKQKSNQQYAVDTGFRISEGLTGPAELSHTRS